MIMEDPHTTRLPSIASLMSPPEPKPLDDFHSLPQRPRSESQKPVMSPATARHVTPLKRHLPSPPVSPYHERPSKRASSYSGHERKPSDLKDPVLYPESENGTDIEVPLFPPERAVNTEEIIDKHMAMHMLQFKEKLNRPTRDEYRLALACVPTVGAIYNQDPLAYYKRSRDEQENDYWQAKRICAPQGLKAPPVAIAPAPKAGKRALYPPTPRSAQQQHRIKRSPKASPIAKLMNFPPKGAAARGGTPDAKGQFIKRDDVDFDSLPDYTPPLSTLPSNNPHVFKTDWTANMLDLSADPHRHLLHEAELNLAAKLRLSCAKYLCCKRRLFEARLNALRIGKEFRKTDAQQSCSVDVNKASRLWSAYEKVGWLEARFVEPYL